MKKQLIMASAIVSISSMAVIASAQSMQNSNAQKPDVVVLAKDYIPAQSTNVALGGPNNIYGADVLLNAPPYQDVNNTATFRFVVPKGRGGRYNLFVEYAALSPRPTNIMVNSKFFPTAMNAATGCWETTCQQLLIEGAVTLKPGVNSIVVRRTSVFPHIRKFVFRAPGIIAD